MKIVNSILLIGVLTFFLSCKNDKKNNDGTIIENDQQTDVDANQFDNQLEEALYNGYYIKNENGYDVAILENTLYLLRANASEDQKNKHFFMHILPKNGNPLHFDFLSSEYLMTDQLSENFADVRVYKRDLPKIEGAYDINVGQYEGEIRAWNSYIMVDKLNKVDYKYMNEYVKYTKSNRYLDEFKTAFDEGYFMKHVDGYDMLLDMHTLYYIKENGTDSDLRDMFFLHIKYDHKDKVYNLDFKPQSYQINHVLGNKFENFIILKRNLPQEGKVTEIATGQFDNDYRTWSYVYEIDKLYDDMAFIYDGEYGSALK